MKKLNYIVLFCLAIIASACHAGPAKNVTQTTATISVTTNEVTDFAGANKDTRQRLGIEREITRDLKMERMQLQAKHEHRLDEMRAKILLGKKDSKDLEALESKQSAEMAKKDYDIADREMNCEKLTAIIDSREQLMKKQYQLTQQLASGTSGDDEAETGNRLTGINTGLKTVDSMETDWKEFKGNDLPYKVKRDHNVGHDFTLPAHSNN